MKTQRKLSLFFPWTVCDTKAPSDLATVSRMSQPSVGSQGSGSGAKPTSAAGLGDRKSPRHKLLDQTRESCHSPQNSQNGCLPGTPPKHPCQGPKGKFLYRSPYTCGVRAGISLAEAGRPAAPVTTFLSPHHLEVRGGALGLGVRSWDFILPGLWDTRQVPSRSVRLTRATRVRLLERRPPRNPSLVIAVSPVPGSAWRIDLLDKHMLKR